jgi:hypothetical protein
MSLVVIDPAVEDWHTLVSGVAADANLLVLDRTRDGIAAIADAVDLRNLSALHVVAHGHAGEIDLGSVTLSSANLDHYVEALACIGRALTDGAILCSMLAMLRAARRVVRSLKNSRKSPAPMWRRRAIGFALGGSWRLDVQIGAITGGLPFTTAALAD